MDKETFKIGECPECGQAITPVMFIGPCTVKCHNCNGESYARLYLISERQMREEEEYMEDRDILPF
jgi:hypothetical protein